VKIEEKNFIEKTKQDKLQQQHQMMDGKNDHKFVEPKSVSVLFLLYRYYIYDVQLTGTQPCSPWD
jgi:hypothetical protein